MDPSANQNQPSKARKWSSEIPPGHPPPVDPQGRSRNLGAHGDPPVLPHNPFSDYLQHRSELSVYIQKYNKKNDDAGQSDKPAPVKGSPFTVKHIAPQSPSFVPLEDESSLFVLRKEPSSSPFIESVNREQLVSPSPRREPAVARKSGVFRSPSPVSVSSLVLAGSDNDSLPDSDEQPSKPEIKRKRGKGASPVKGSLPSVSPLRISKHRSPVRAVKPLRGIKQRSPARPIEQQQRLAKQGSPVRAAEALQVSQQKALARLTAQPSRPIQKPRASSAVKNKAQLPRKSGGAIQLARKSGGLRKERGHTYMGIDGVQDTSEDSNDDLWVMFRNLFGGNSLDKDEGHRHDEAGEKSDGKADDKVQEKTEDGSDEDLIQLDSESDEDLIQLDDELVHVNIEDCKKATTTGSETPVIKRQIQWDETPDLVKDMLASASSKHRLSVEKSKIDGAGWGLTTLDKIHGAGQILNKYVLVHAMDFKSKDLVCDNCFFAPKKEDRKDELRPCPDCRTSYYCSSKCKDEAYISYHWAECLVAQRHPDFADMQATWRIAFRILIRHYFEAEFEPSWKQILMLRSNKDKMHPNSPKMRSAAKLWRFLEPIIQTLVPETAPSTLASPSGKGGKPGHRDYGYDPIDFLLRVFLNTGTLLLPGTPDPGAIFDPLLSMVNHDCRPNAFPPICERGGRMILHARRTIPAGEEIKVSYVDASLPLMTRSFYLTTNWHFDCSCERCRTEAAASEDQ